MLPVLNDEFKVCLITIIGFFSDFAALHHKSVLTLTCIHDVRACQLLRENGRAQSFLFSLVLLI